MTPVDRGPERLCRAGPLTARLSNRNRSSRRSAISLMLSADTRAAASSSASGCHLGGSRWSSAQHVARPDHQTGRAARARSANRAIAPNSSISSSEGSCPRQGNFSDGTRQMTSPGTPRPSRLVARIHSLGQLASNCTAIAAAPARTCSQLSRTKSRLCGRRTLISRCARSSSALSSTPISRATVAHNEAGSGVRRSSQRNRPRRRTVSLSPPLPRWPGASCRRPRNRRGSKAGCQ